MQKKRISYKTTWRWHPSGIIAGVKMSARTILVVIEEPENTNSV